MSNVFTLTERRLRLLKRIRQEIQLRSSVTVEIGYAQVIDTALTELAQKLGIPDEEPDEL